MRNSRASELSRFHGKNWFFDIAWTIGSTSCAGIMHDLSNDVGTTQNPSLGPADGWGYNKAGFGGPFGQDSPGDFGGGRLSWRDSRADDLGGTQITHAGGYRAPADAFDFPTGGVITHAAASIAWQARAGTDGLYVGDISVWQVRDLDRSVDPQLWKNDSRALTGHRHTEQYRAGEFQSSLPARRRFGACRPAKRE